LAHNNHVIDGINKDINPLYGDPKEYYLELAKDENGNNIPCWSIFFMGKKSPGDHWGFQINGKMIHHEEFLNNRDKYPING